MSKYRKRINSKLVYFVILFLVTILTSIDLANKNSNILQIINFNKFIKVKSDITYSDVLNYIELGLVKKIDLYGQKAVIFYSEPFSSEPEILPEKKAQKEISEQMAQSDKKPITLDPELKWITMEIPENYNELLIKIKEFGVDFDAHEAVPDTAKFIRTRILIPTMTLSALVFFTSKPIEIENDTEKSNDLEDDSFDSEESSEMDFSKSRARRFNKKTAKLIFFDDIAGIDQVKNQFIELVSFLKEPERYQKFNARMPRGVLLIGPPGTGKTLLARAVANEADVPFFSTGGSEFVEIFVGIGAARVRDLFQQASAVAPSIIFIDEIDAIGRTRNVGAGGGSDERDQTLNQLLTEMDGFKSNKDVLVIGATNRGDILDSALTRPGRFDRKIRVNLPNQAGRLAILKVHSKKKAFASDVSLVEVANRTNGFSGAGLAGLLNESAILATRENVNLISQKHITEAIDRVLFGIAKPRLRNNKNKRLIAYQRVSQAVIGSLLMHHEPVDRITLIPRGRFKALTIFVNDGGIVTRDRILAKMTSSLAFRAAEQVVFGECEISTSSTPLIKRVTKMAQNIVIQAGLSPIGPIELKQKLRKQPETFHFGNLNDRVDDHVLGLVNYCEKIALHLISENRVIIDVIVEELIVYDTMSGARLRELLSMYTKIRKKKF